MTFGRALLVAVALVAPCSAETATPPASLTLAEARRLVADRDALVLDLSAVAQLEPDVAGVLAEFSGLLDLSGLAEVGPDVAAALAGCTGLLDLSGVAALTPETAAALARCRGAVDLSGLRSMTPETARALGGYRGRQLRLTFAAFGPDFEGSRLKDDLAQADIDWLHADVAGLRLHRLTAEELPLLQWLTRTPTWRGYLPGVTAFESPDSVAIAKFLATRRGPLSLPNLKRISPKTLSALLEKEDIDIPLIETLDLIPEPDGSVTEDFVIPERFQGR
jgi:hypothetical protein